MRNKWKNGKERANGISTCQFSTYFVFIYVYMRQMCWLFYPCLHLQYTNVTITPKSIRCMILLFQTWATKNLIPYRLWDANICNLMYMCTLTIWEKERERAREKETEWNTLDNRLLMKLRVRGNEQNYCIKTNTNARNNFRSYTERKKKRITQKR